MRKQFLNPKGVFDPGFLFTHTVAIEGAARLVHVSGQVSYDERATVVGKGDMRAQTEQVFDNLTNCLKAAGADWADVIKLNGYMVGLNPESVKAYREVRSKYLDPTRLPASTLVGVERLVHPDLLLEVELVAALSVKAAAKKRKKRR